MSSTQGLFVVFLALSSAMGGLGGCVADRSEYAGCAPQNPDCRSVHDTPTSPSGASSPPTSGKDCTSVSTGSFHDDFECPGWSRYDGPCSDPNTASGTLALDQSGREAPSTTTSLASALPMSGSGPRLEACLFKSIRVDHPSGVELELDLLVDTFDSGIVDGAWAAQVASVAFENEAGEPYAFAVAVGYENDGVHVVGPSWTLLAGPVSTLSYQSGALGEPAQLGGWVHLAMMIGADFVVLSVDGVVAARLQTGWSVKGASPPSTQLDLRTGLVGTHWGGAGPSSVHIDEVRVHTTP